MTAVKRAWNDVRAEEMVPGDIATAQAFGKRIADATAKFAR